MEEVVMDPKEVWQRTLQAAAGEYEADIYFYSGAIDDAGLGLMVSAVAENKQRDRALLILVTDGGQANAGYQIARLFQKVYNGKFSIFCPSRCKSAGTLVALGADRLIMDQFSELGPLDVQLFKQNEIMLRKSGLLARSSFDALADASFELYERLMIGITVRSQGNVSFQVASEVSAQMASRLMAGVYSQINPDVVGTEKRDLEIAKEYGERLVSCSGNASDASVHALVYFYPSHDFIIDDDEARTLFKNIDFPQESLYQIVGFLGEAAYNEATPTIAVALTRRAQEDVEDDDDHEGAAESGSSIRSGGSVDDSGRADRSGDTEAANDGVDGDKANSTTSSDEDNTPPADVHPLRVLKGGETDR